MALKITCPHCNRPMRLEEPYPMPGSERQCACGRNLSISYPIGMMDLLKQRGARFMEDEPPARPMRPTASWPPPDPPSTSNQPTTPDGTAPRPTSPTSQLSRPDAARPLPPRPSPDIRPVQPSVRPPVASQPASRPPAPPRAPQPATSKPPTRPPAKKRSFLPQSRLARFFLFSLVVFLLLAGAGGIAAAGVLMHYSKDLPTLEILEKYRPPTVTVVYDSKNRLLGEIYEKRRYVVELDAMPRHLKDAFIAAEDAGFYQHNGIDYMGILRAMGRNASQGRMAQGASTITQQVARNFLLNNEKTFERKIREVLLAWRIEDSFSKEHILYLYLNQIYLGSGSYGVEAAARVYFGKHVEELTLAESALIAGLPQRPSDYSPHRHLDKAKARQGYVLDQMVEKKLITEAEAVTARKEPLNIVERTNEFLLKAPWFTEHVRRYLVEKYGFDKVYNDGLIVEVTCDLDLQQVAQEAVTSGVSKTDARSGWRGPNEHIDSGEIPAYIANLARKTDSVLEGSRYTGVVTSIKKKYALLSLGDQQAVIPTAWSGWAYKSESGARTLDDMGKSLRVGDVVTVEIEASNLANNTHKDATMLKNLAAEVEKDTGTAGPFVAAYLYQAPELQGALFSMRNSDGAVVAMVGGVDFKATEFNRAIQAYRQVGSTFKPIVYAAAIASRRFTAATIIPDAPLIFKTIGAEYWKPENYGSTYLGDITLRKALALSRNVVTIRVLDTLKPYVVSEMARNLGITSKMEDDLAMGLGAASLTMPEMTMAYASFATLGKEVKPRYVNRVLDRDNTVLEAWEANPQAQVLDPGVAGIMTWLLQEVATNGTAARSQSLGLHVAGKTGTTNDFRDAWFVGYTRDLTTSVWVGYDQPRTIGSSATGGSIALPIWMDYYKVAIPRSQDRDFPAAPGIVWAGIDESTGYSVQGGRSMPFLPGTVPTAMNREIGQKTSEELLTTEF